ncbi:MAG: Na+/H+ antiporter NhaA [Chloroflexota bacterium]|nr:Na+/H+ antiporter NhaA [Chloroflexota bacterium]
MSQAGRTLPVEEHPRIERVLYPIREFMHAEASGGLVLMLSAIAALVWANSAWGEAYTRLWQTKVTIGPHGYALSETLHHWINDGLMAVFFFVVGLEIKREVLVGELSSLRQASLPIAAALGGMVVPALIYTALNLAGEGAAGWGVPMATDIAFALGVMALLGSRIPTSLRIFLTGLAIADDMGAVLVIALFYTSEIHWGALGVAGGFLVLLVVANRLHVRHAIAYALLGLGLWVAFLESGVHATIAGVLLAMTIPARTRIDTASFLRRGREILEEFDRAGEEGSYILVNGAQQAAVGELEAACERVQSPMQRLEHSLHPWVAFGIVPLFALANAGVQLEGDLGRTLAQPVTLGIVLGLVVGKQVGVTLVVWLAVRFGLTDLPEGASWHHINGVGWLAGIGFTMSLFVSSLAFGEGELLGAAKTGILLASLLAGVGGWLILRTAKTASPRGAR